MAFIVEIYGEHLATATTQTGNLSYPPPFFLLPPPSHSLRHRGLIGILVLLVTPPPVPRSLYPPPFFLLTPPSHSLWLKQVKVTSTKGRAGPRSAESLGIHQSH